MSYWCILAEHQLWTKGYTNRQEEETYFGPTKVTDHMRSKGKTKNKQWTPKGGKRFPKDFSLIGNQFGMVEETTVTGAEFLQHVYS